MTLRNAFEDVATEATQSDVKTAAQSIDTKTPALVGGAVPVTVSGIATDTKQDTGNASLASIDSKTPALSGGAVPVVVSGVATAARQDTGNTSLASIDSKTPALSGGAVPVVVSGVATAARQDTGNTSLASIDTKVTGVATAARQDTGNTSLASIDTKVTGVATAARQDTGNTSLASLDSKTPALSGGAVPVVVSGVATSAKQDAEATLVGAVNETAPASDTASSGLNGRLQRVAQRLSSLLALTPALGSAATTAATPVTIASDDSQFGAKTTGSSMSSGGSGFIGWLSDLVTQAKSALALFTATAYADSNRLPVDERDCFSVSGSVTSAATLFTQDMLGYESISVQVTNAGTTCTITYECSDDNTNWVSISGVSTAAVVGTGGNMQPSTTSNAAVANIFSRKARYFRARVSTYTSGTVSVVGTLHKSSVAPVVTVAGATMINGTSGHATAIGGNPVRIAGRALTSNYTAVATGQTADLAATLVGAVIQKPYSIPEADWHYVAPTAGILNNTTTAVTVAAAAGAGLRNYITSIDLSTDAFGAASVLAIRDGAAGTVIWAMKISTSGLVNGRTVQFETPLKSTANTLLEIVTITANTSGLVFPNVHGYIAP